MKEHDLDIRNTPGIDFRDLPKKPIIHAVDFLADLGWFNPEVLSGKKLADFHDLIGVENAVRLDGTDITGTIYGMRSYQAADILWFTPFAIHFDKELPYPIQQTSRLIVRVPSNTVVGIDFGPDEDGKYRFAIPTAEPGGGFMEPNPERAANSQAPRLRYGAQIVGVGQTGNFPSFG